MKIEKEVRYFLSNDKFDDLIKKLLKNYKYTHSYHEITTMYDNPNPDLTFYSKEIDGRLRLRYSNKVDAPKFGPSVSGGIDKSQCLITWKRRLPGGTDGAVRREEEIEYLVDSKEFESVKSIFEDVLKCKRVSSYERIRNFLSTASVQVTCDQFPYGIMLEFELKDESNEQLLLDEVEKLGLEPDDASNLSCDDMYFKLCKEQGVKILSDIIFDDPTMPKI
jgi:hypothetical protein